MAKATDRPDLDKLIKCYESMLADSRNLSPAIPERSGNNKSFWLGLSSVASSVFAMSATVDAAVLYSGIQNITLPNGNNDSVAIDINGDTIDDFTFFTFNTNTSSGYGYAGIFAGGNGVAINGLGLIADKLNVGDIIDGRMLFLENGNEALMRSVDGSGSVNPNMEWGASSTGLMGAKLNVGTDDYYAWIRVSLSTGTSGYPEDFLILDWAYEDTGAPIIAGSVQSLDAPPPEVSAVPLQGSLGLLASGVAGLAAFRRRQKE